ncbi:MAG: NAD-glutamate dehydrogenase [Desulfuromonadales bacterium]|nr:NAD-glutamate dehydrogenase [Desulfuromonadales bacterium]
MQAATGRCDGGDRRGENSQWLNRHLPPYFFTAMKDEPEALAILTRDLGNLQFNRSIVLADREKSLIKATVSRPGGFWDTLRQSPEREISYAMITQSKGSLPGVGQTLEIQRLEFDRKSNEEILAGTEVVVPAGIAAPIRQELEAGFPDFDLSLFDPLLRILWLNNPSYVRVSPPLRLAQILSLYQQANQRGGLSLEMATMPEGKESRLLFAVGNPPQKDFILQIMEVFKRLEIRINRSYCLTISNGTHPYFLGSFYLRRLDGGVIEPQSPLFTRLQHELYNTQLLFTDSHTYREFVVNGAMSGMDATLVNSFIYFCYTNLAHNQPDRFGLDDVRSAFYSHPDITLQLLELFRARFDPARAERLFDYKKLLAEAQKGVAEYNTGHRYLDDVRRAIFRCCLLFIQYTLKTNFFVLEKNAVAFRLDPGYLAHLGMGCISDLPQAMPFRITFFYSRFGFGNHIGFSDIARGGWRTVIARTEDDFITNSASLFRENFVLAHTQHLKNKDIYEGGSKMVLIMNAADLGGAQAREQETLRLYKLQYGVANAFLDIFITDHGVARDARVVDYYREDEPIELGPDENMHDVMVEEIARLSRKRGYILGIGIMSSKAVGINHKEYGVTSRGVVKFAEITMAECGIDMASDPFTVKITGGPNGDVAGNAMRLLLERCPQVSIRLIVDGPAILYDPLGANREELGRILLRENLDAFNPAALNPGGYLIFRTGSRLEGFKPLYRKVSRSEAGLLEEWISIDELSRAYSNLLFSVEADLFLPAGGRPETIDASNWERFILDTGKPSSPIIVEGANSFITPEARVALQQHGVIILRDASANKCGVISSSYEIIANLLFSEEEFLQEKERYVNDVLQVLETVSEYEAKLILKRRRENPTLLCTEISDAISNEINAHYSRLFRFFQEQPQLCDDPKFRRVIIGHLPLLLQLDERFKERYLRLPRKYLFAIMAAELGSSMVYRGDKETAYEDEVRLHIERNFPPDGVSHLLHRQAF